MRILIFNWKDVANPEAGGAESYLHECARRWAASGHDVTLFCRSFPGGRARDERDGVGIVRRGGRFTVYREAVRFWEREGRGYDLVVDGANTRPFMTPRFVDGTPIVLVVHQLAAEVWHEEMPPVVGHIGRYILEPRWLSAYRQIPTIAVSDSTKTDLLRLGFTDVNVVPNGLPIPPLNERPVKEAVPTLIYVGRLVNTKRALDAVRAHALIQAVHPRAQLWVIGDGYLRRRLERVAPPGVTFFGRVDEAVKYELMARAHCALVPGVREGWGLVVVETGAMGTPAVGYRIAGLVDSIVDGSTGVLVDPNPRALADAAISLLENPARLEALADNARAWVRQFDWNRTARAVLDAGLEASHKPASGGG